MTDALSALARHGLPIALAALVASAVVAAAETPGSVTVYVGTYTDGTSRGIYRFSLDLATGLASAPALAGAARNPSFLALHPGRRFLYAASETSDFGGAATGALSAFAIDAQTGDLKLLNQQPSEGAGPCHLVVDRGGRHVLVANYEGGTVAVLKIAPDGRLQPASAVRRHAGRGPDAARQDEPHAHGIYLDAGERFALSPDLGADRVFVYRFDAEQGTLEPHGEAPLAPGSGPRHLAFHPSGRYLYVINELTSTVTAFAYDPQRGTLASLQTVSTLPEGFSGTSYTAEVEVSPDGRYLYGSNRGHDSLAVFRIETTSGRLTAAGHVPVGGSWPRHFTIPAPGLLLAAHQRSGTISAFRLDPTNGRPTPLGTRVEVDRPACLLPVAPR